MATCTASISRMAGYGSLVEILPNTVTPFNVTQTENNLFRLECPQFQTIKFIINTVPPVALTLTAYAWNGSTATPIGSVTMTNPTTVAYIDFNIGQYIICIRPSGMDVQTGTLLGEFTGYSQEAKLALNMFAGESFESPVSGPPTPPRECDEALFFEIIDGELPPGLDMNPFGVVKGWLPNLDCLEDRWSPAVNWYYEENDGTMWPWGREWRFQVRVTVDGQTSLIRDEEWFCVRVYNNWTYDAERFLAQQPFERITEITVKDPPPVLPSICKPCKDFTEEPRFVPQSLEHAKASTLPSDPEETKIELIPIPLDLCHIPSTDFAQWYDENRDVDSGNIYVEKFKRDLEESPSFNLLRARAGYTEADPLMPHQRERLFVIAQNYQNFLQLSSIILKEGEGDEYKSMVRAWQVEQNQSLPYQMIGYAGDMMEITLR